MNTGMLWFDNDPRKDLVTKITLAAEYYTRKYGCRPDLCFVNPASAGQMLPKTAGIEVRSHQMILPNHFWLGLQNA